MFDQLIQDAILSFPILAWAVLALTILILQMAFQGQQRLSIVLAGVGLAILLTLDILQFDSSLKRELFTGAVVWDVYSQIFTILAKIMVLALVLMLIPGSLVQTKLFKSSYEQIPEFLICLLFSGMGVSLLASAGDVTSLFLGLEILSIALYCLCGFYRSEIRSTESALKYLLIGAFSTVIFLYGIAFLYGATGATSYVAIAKAVSGAEGHPIFLTLAAIFLVAGLGFKLALVPFHLYTADVYEGAPTPVTGYLASIVKVGILAASLRLLWGVLGSVSHLWSEAWVALCLLSVVVGNVMALQQRSVKKILAFSSVSHAGFLGLALLVARPGEGSSFPLLSYLTVYSAMTLGIFAILTLIETPERSLLVEDLKGLGRKNIWMGFGMGIFLFGMAGIPPFAGFMIKFWIFQELIAQHYTGAAVVAVLGSLIGAGYYLKLLMHIFISEDECKIVAPLRDPIFSLRLVILFGIALTLFGSLRPQLYADWFLGALALK